MEFATAHGLLSYLVEVEDDPERSDALHLGVSFRELAQREGKIAIDSSQERDRFARLLFMLKDDGGVNFFVQPGYEPDGTALGVTSQHADMVLDIRATSEGRLAVQGAAIHALLRSLSTSITTHLDAIDALIDEVAGSPEEKEKAHEVVRGARDVAASAVGSLIASATTVYLKTLGVHL